MSPDTHPMQARAPMLAGAAGEISPPRHYRVFISYSHADTAWANWLMRRLEGYRVAARFRGRAAPIGVVGPRIAPVFRDRDELPTTSDLGETIRTALRESATLVVICSPASAKSHWVHQEILEFKRLGGERRVFAFIVDGEPKNDGAIDDCFSPALRSALGPDGNLSDRPAEHVAADARPQGDGKEDAFVRLVAGLLGVGFDELRQRELQRRYRRLTFIATGSVLGMALTLGLAAIAWQARNDAQRRQEQAEDLLGFMVGDLRTQLAKVGRIEVLDAVGEKANTYFASLNSRDLTDTALTRKVEALRQIGENRKDQAMYPEAMRLFLAAYDSAKVLVARHPAATDMLFERAQAEYWIGFVCWKRGEIPAAKEWLTRYNDTCTALVALEPGQRKWRTELASGLHNLAVLRAERGELAAARADFTAKLATLRIIAAAEPDDFELQFRIADTISWLGTLAERDGQLAAAIEHFTAQAHALEDLVRKDPRTARWREKLAMALALKASVLAITGQPAASLESRQQAAQLLESLVAQDANNRAWQTLSLTARTKEATLLLATGDVAEVRRLVDSARSELEKLAKIAPADRKIAGLLATAWRLEAELRAAAGRADATEAIARALAIGEELVAKDRADDELRGNYLGACVAAGRIARQLGQEEAARQHWQRAADILLPRVSESNNWRLLDPSARALALLGRGEESGVIIARLRRFGYQPLEPWPEGMDAKFLSAKLNP